MFYIILFWIFLIGSLISLFMKYKLKWLFIFFSSLLLVVTTFRYGLGTDYFAYQYHYSLMPNNFTSTLEMDSHMDLGFRILMFIVKKYNFKFYIFTAILGFMTLIFYIVTIAKNSKKPIVSLFLLYALYWLIYVNSALRQGLAMSIFIFAFYDLMNNKNIIRYIFLILFASLFHKVALIGLAAIFIYKLYKRFFTNRQFNILLLLLALFVFLIRGDVIVRNILNQIGISMSYVSSGSNIFAIILRIINIVLFYFIYKMINPRDKTEDIKFQLYFYFISVLIFISTANTPILSRSADYLMIMEIIMVPNLLASLYQRFDKLVLTGIIITISGILFLKDMSADLQQGNYYDKSIQNYPYITLFERDKIRYYRLIKIGTID